MFSIEYYVWVQGQRSGLDQSITLTHTTTQTVPGEIQSGKSVCHHTLNIEKLLNENITPPPQPEPPGPRNSPSTHSPRNPNQTIKPFLLSLFCLSCPICILITSPTLILPISYQMYGQFSLSNSFFKTFYFVSKLTLPMFDFFNAYFDIYQW